MPKPNAKPPPSSSTDAEGADPAGSVCASAVAEKASGYPSSFALSALAMSPSAEAVAADDGMVILRAAAFVTCPLPSIDSCGGRETSPPQPGAWSDAGP